MTSGSGSGPPDARSRVLRAKRNLCVAACATVALTLALLAVLGLRSWTGFVRPHWIGLATALAGGAWGLSLIALQTTFAAARKAVPVPGAALPRYFHQVARTRVALAGILLFVAGGYLVVAGAETAVPAALLGAHPARAAALSLTRGHSCPKCPVAISVTFRVSDRQVTAVLTGGSSAGDKTDMALAFDPVRPTRVMRAGDWSAGRGARGAGQLGAGVALVITVLVGTFAIGRRRRRKFGHLRPEVALRSVARATRRTGSAWTVQFADGAAADYLNTPALRAALRARLGAAGLAVLDPSVRRALE